MTGRARAVEEPRAESRRRARDGAGLLVLTRRRGRIGIGLQRIERRQIGRHRADIAVGQRRQIADDGITR